MTKKWTVDTSKLPSELIHRLTLQRLEAEEKKKKDKPA